MPGVCTPTEALTAWQLGADMVKWFPASIGGAAHAQGHPRTPCRSLRSFLSAVSTWTTAAAFIRCGAAALGVGGSLINQSLLDAGNMSELTRRAEAFLAAVREGRNSHGPNR